MTRTRTALLTVLGLLACGAAAWLLWPTGPAPVRYQVARGDTLWRIAREHGVPVEPLKEWNGLDGALIEVGQVLLLYPGSVPEERPRHGSRRRPTATGGGVVQVRSALRSDQPLRMPEEQPCLAPPSEDDLADSGAEPGYLASQGLDPQVVSARMQAFLPTLWRCVPDGELPEGSAFLELTVACTGRVSEVAVLDSEGLDGALVSCVADTLRYVGFPPHDMPGGFVFQYPVHFSVQ